MSDIAWPRQTLAVKLTVAVAENLAPYHLSQDRRLRAVGSRIEVTHDWAHTPRASPRLRADHDDVCLDDRHFPHCLPRFRHRLHELLVPAAVGAERNRCDLSGCSRGLAAVCRRRSY